MKSTTVSASSPTTGAAKADLAAAPAPAPVSIHFEVLRGRAIGWAVFGIATGTLLLVLMGTVAQWLGAVLVGIGVISVWVLARTYVLPAAMIVVNDEGVALPRARCTRTIDRAPLRDVTAAYFLRRSASWTRAAPVLVIEAAGKAYAYPRDWFANEAEQRRIIHAILGRIRPEAIAGIAAQPAAAVEDVPLVQKTGRSL